ncbi:hypothetical protein Hbl1158_04325 [Halobaculum sp. CBA1158]|uniref:HalOD1 output domain-containing protein n=1 Tax=Halobaculum sp. CBA1158 TaxID=2904243 RepID=UPI001F3DD60E|nr:HalOD1 output domain-containing protein [Halobaculum sp. CBA1158]UIP00594.1 hypothetical protein Hbl1158_04325 [Halobaculum sp. CBA1158]
MPSDRPSDIDVDYDPETERYSAEFDPEAVTATVAVVEVTAAIRDASSMSHDPLFEVIDTAAVDRLCRGSHDADDVAIEFTYLDHHVRVEAEGRIAVSPLDSEA